MTANAGTARSGRIGLWALSGLLVASALFACGRGQPVESRRHRDVEILSDAGRLAATLYPSLEAHSPGLLLLHGDPGNRSDWVLFATRAQQAGFTCLAPDLRWAKDASGKVDPEALTGEVRACLDSLQREGADPKRIGLVGADVGANLALHYAAENSDVEAVALVSPGMELGGIRAEDALHDYGHAPVFFLTALGDAYAADSARKLQELSKGFAELREYPGAAHGTDMFTTSENASAQLLDWLKTVLK